MTRGIGLVKFDCFSHHHHRLQLHDLPECYMYCVIAAVGNCPSCNEAYSSVSDTDNFMDENGKRTNFSECRRCP